MQVGVLGPLAVVRDGVPIALPRSRERCLLAVLAMHVGEAVPPAALVEALWPGPPWPRHPDKSLQTVVSRLRRALGREAIDREPGGYRLTLAAEAVDARRFESMLAEARPAVGRDPEDALRSLDAALALWRGDAYQEFADWPFALADVARLDELRLSAIELRFDAALAVGRQEALAELQAATLRHPFAEGLCTRLALALYRSGRQTEALAALRDYRRRLADDLGLEPTPALGELEWRVLAHRVEETGAGTAPPTGRSRATPRPREEVGVPLRRLIGRDALAAAVVDALGAAPLVTLSGPGGVGKTQLALYVCESAGDRYRHGVAACHLAAVRDAGLVPAALLTALDVRRRQHRTVEESLVEALAGRESLLLLDNCEHVADAVADLLTRLLAQCPGVVVLATSRQRLGLRAERLIDVPPLAVPGPGEATEGSAIELFGERATAAGARLADDAVTREAVREICRRVDGLPLAIELAAAHVRALRPEGIVDRLIAGPAPLRAPLRDLAERHRSLESVAGWSYGLLEESEKALFEGLSVFAGPFEREAVEAVARRAWRDTEAIPELLEALVDKSMLAVAEDGAASRYRLLETLRTYAAARLAERGAEESWRRAHAEHHLAVAEAAERGLRGPAEASWMRRIAGALDDFREARRWSARHDVDLAARLVAALGWFRFRTLSAELESWAEETAAAASDHPSAPLLFGGAALGAWSRGDLERARRLASRGLSGPDGPSGRLARDALGAICLVRGDLLDALHHFDRAVSLGAEAGDVYHQAWCLGSKAIVLAQLGRHSQASAALERASSMARAVAAPSLTAWVLYVRGECMLERDPDQALDLLDRSQAVAADAGHEFVRGVAGVSAITLRVRRGEDRVALERFAAHVRHLDRLGNRTQLWTMLRSLVCVLAREGEVRTAAVLAAAEAVSATAPAAYGPDRDRLEEARSTVAEAMDGPELATCAALGEAMTDGEAVTYALDAIEDALRPARPFRSKHP